MVLDRQAFHRKCRSVRILTTDGGQHSSGLTACSLQPFYEGMILLSLLLIEAWQITLGQREDTQSITRAQQLTPPFSSVDV